MNSDTVKIRGWALQLEYDGTPFIGWQSQRGESDASGRAIQSVLETACARLNGGYPVASIAAGRTDSGVHAEAQIAWVGLGDSFTADTLREGLNFHMKPNPVVVVRAAPALPGWNPRFAALGRAYRYRILNRRARPALMLNRAWHVRPPLDDGAMRQAALPLLGLHDFTSFRATACQAKSPVRRIDRLEVVRDGDSIEIIIEARSFLHHQVRNIAGTLKLVGEGKLPVDGMTAILAARERKAAGPTAPPEGLSLTRVWYETDPFG